MKALLKDKGGIADLLRAEPYAEKTAAR